MQGSHVGVGVGAFLLVSAALASSSRAQTPGRKPVEGDVALDYLRDPTASACPAEATLRERAADVFDFRDPFVAHGALATWHVRVEITRAAGVYHGVIHTVDESGAAFAVSTEEHADCDALVWTLGHRVGLAVLKRPAQPSPDAPPPPPPATTAASPPAPTAPPSPSPAPRATAPAATCDDRCMNEVARRIAARTGPANDIGVTLRVGAVITAGWTAESGPGAWLGFAVQRGWFALGLEARGLFPAKTLTYEVGRSSYAATFSGLIVPCARWKVLAGCAFLEAGSYIFTIPGRDPGVSNALISVGPRAAIDIPIASGFAFHAFADLAIHPYLPVFAVRMTTEADSEVRFWVTPVVSGVFGAGLAWSR